MKEDNADYKNSNDEKSYADIGSNCFFLLICKSK